MPEPSTPCPICAREEALPQPEFEHFLACPEPYRIVRCQVCGMVYLSPRPTPADMEGLYTSDEYAPEVYLRRSRVVDRIPDFERAYAKLETYLPHKGLLLEFGCAAGHFLDVGRKRGWRVQGIDASPTLAAYARDHFGLDVRVATSLRQAGIAPGSIDAIYTEHVLEHLADPLELLMQAKEALREGGYLVISVPNELDEIRYALRRSVFRRWASDISQGHKCRVGHINFFTLKTMVHIVKRAGLTPVSCSTWGATARRPMVKLSRSPFKRWGKEACSPRRTGSAKAPTSRCSQ